MFHNSVLLLGILAAITGLSLAFLSQRYWFARAWGFGGGVAATTGLAVAFLSQGYWFARAGRFGGRIQHPAWRRAVRATLLAILGLVALIALADVVRNWRGTVSRGTWWTPFFGLWLSSSIFSYLFIKTISGADWLWRRMRSLFSGAAHTPAASSATP